MIVIAGGVIPNGPGFLEERGVALIFGPGTPIPEAAERSSMRSTPTAEAILAGDRRALAKAITLVESQRESDREAAQALLKDVFYGQQHSRWRDGRSRRW